MTYPKLFDWYLDLTGFTPNVRMFIMDELSSPHRHWHGLVHHAIMLKDVAMQFHLAKGTDLPHRQAIIDGIVATFFHDIVYDGTRTDNEEQSVATMKFWLDPERYDINVLSEMILRTKTHGLARTTWRDRNFLIADLAILWTANPALYAFYARGIRKEYAHVSNDVWRDRRPAVLDDLRRECKSNIMLLGNDQYGDLLDRNIDWEQQNIARGDFDL